MKLIGVVKHFKKILLLACFANVCWINLYAQTLTPVSQADSGQPFYFKTQFPFLRIQSDARAAAMGEAGVATVPNAGSMSTNSSKLSFLEQQYGLSISYIPWLKNIVDDVNLISASGFWQLDERSTIGGSLRYFSLGEIQLNDDNQGDLGIHTPNEYAVDLSYIRKFGRQFSLGSTIRYVNSALIPDPSVALQVMNQTAYMVDISGYYQQALRLGGTDVILSTGMLVSNVGAVSTNSDIKQPLPSNLKIGTAFRLLPDDLNEFSIALDYNRSLFHYANSTSPISLETNESALAFGLEYVYNQKFSIRGGYYYELPKEAINRYLTLGAGFKKEFFEVDFAYLVADRQRSPLANTLRLTILLNFGTSIMKY